MAQFQGSVGPNLGGNGPDRPTLTEPDRGRLRLLMIGELALVRESILQMHQGTYQVDMLLWSPPLAIPETGLILPRYPGQVLTYLQKPQHVFPQGHSIPPAPSPR